MYPFLPAMAQAWDTANRYMTGDPLPAFYEGPICGHTDPAFGECQMPTSHHTLHRSRWAGFEASWAAF